VHSKSLRSGELRSKGKELRVKSKVLLMLWKYPVLRTINIKAEPFGAPPFFMDLTDIYKKTTPGGGGFGQLYSSAF
jgi:hypothetical protein